MRFIKNSFFFLFSFFSSIFYFPLWWYVKNLHFWFLFFTRALRLIADGLAISAFLRHFFAPYREDRTFVGFGIGILFRTFWIAASIFLFLASAVFLLIAFLVYLAWPLTFLFAIIEILEGYPIPAVMWGLLFLPAVLVYCQWYVRQPRKTASQLVPEKNRAGSESASQQDIVLVMTPTARKLWRRYKDKHFKPDLTIGDISDFAKMLFAAPKIKDIFLRLDFGQKEQEEFLQKLSRLKTVSIKCDLNNLAGNILQTAKKFHHKYIDEDIILLALAENIPQLTSALKEKGITVESLQSTISWVEEKADTKESWKFWRDEHFHLRGGGDLAWVAGFIPTLKHFSVDISKLIRQGQIPRIVGRKNEVKEILQTLSRTTQGNVLLVGPSGVGKTSIIYAIAQRLLSGEIEGVSKNLKDKRILQLDIAGIIAGTSGRGDLEWRIKKTLDEIGKGKVILFIDEIEGMVSAGIADYFSPTLVTGDIQIIGATTWEDYKKTIEPQAVFATYFQVIEIPEPADEETINILKGIALEIEKDQGVTITYPAIEAAVKLTRKFIHDRVLPDKAIDLLDETAVFVREKRKKERGKISIIDEDVAEVLSNQVGIPVSKINLEESEKLLNLEEILHRRIVGQNKAIDAIANAMRRARAGLAAGNRPIASFLFLGPTGVGKTETTKALSESYFGTEANMIRFDMSEFSESGLVANFTARLCDTVSRRPFTVILLDEIEKATPEIHNLLLQVLDEGRLTDPVGKTADFTNTMVIGTSNVYQKGQKGIKGVKEEEIEVRRVLGRFFRPELINRFDGIIVFDALTPTQMIEIAKLELAKVTERLREKEIELTFDNGIAEVLAKEGYDSEFGARPLRRVIMEKIEDPISKKILGGRLKAGQKIVVERLPIV